MMGIELKRIDNHLALKPNFLFWLMILFPLKILLVGIAHFWLVKHDVSVLQTLQIESWLFKYYIMAAIPDLILLITYMRRRPGYSPWLASIWKKGRLLLASGLVLSSLPTLLLLASLKSNANTWFVIDLVVNAWLIIYLIKSQYLPTLFASMPEQDIAPSSSR